MLRKLLLILSTVLYLTGCNLLPNPTVRLMTDRPEIAAYMEAYNAAQDQYRVELEYREDPAGALGRLDPPPDLVIAPGLAGQDMADRFASLESLFKNEVLVPSAFYGSLLETGRSEETQYLLPLSFNMPIVVFRSDALAEVPAELFVTPAQIREIAGPYSEEQGGLYRRVGFSPLWDPFFVYYEALLAGADFRIQEGRPRWDAVALDRVVSTNREWVQEMGPAKLREFDQRYRQIPDYQLVRDGRILFYVSLTQSFLAIPREKREELDFRWLGDEQGVPVTSRLLYVGIPRGAENPAGAKALISWFFAPETQTLLMQVNQYKRLAGVFGIAAGLSSLKTVNERDLPQPHHYPVFLGRVPTPEQVAAPPASSRRWLLIQEEVLLPWLREAVENPQDPPTLEAFLAASGADGTN